MFAAADEIRPAPPRLPSPIEREVAEIMDIHQRVVSSRDLLYASPAIRLLIERELPKLARLAAGARRVPGPGPAVPGPGRVDP